MNLILGDCLEKMQDIESGSVDLVIIDPPYKMTKRGKSCRPNYMPGSTGDNLFAGKLPITSDWMKLVYDTMKNDGSHLYIFTNTVSITEYLSIAKEQGFKLHNIISMIKDTGMPSRWYYKQTELVLFFRKGRAKPINDYTSRDNIEVVMPKKINGKLHITQKPLDFIAKFLTNSSNAGDVVLDPFMGSGTTGVACKNLNRNFIGIEMDETYFNIAKERIENT